MSLRTIITGIVLLPVFFAVRAGAAELSDSELEQRFADTVHPFLETYCFECHGEKKQKGKLDLRPY